MHNLKTRKIKYISKKICSVILIFTFLVTYVLPPNLFASESTNYRISTFATTSAGGQGQGTSYDLYQNTIGEAINGDLESQNTKVSSGYLHAISREISQPPPPPSGSDRLAESANFKWISYLLSNASFDSSSTNFAIPLAAVGEPFGGILEGNYNKSFSGYVYTILNNPPILKKNIPAFTLPINSSIADAFDLDDYFADPDGDSLTFSVKGNSDITVSIDPVTHLVSFSQLSGFIGSEDVIFSATDTEGNITASNSVTLNVYDPSGVNNPPVLNFIPDITAKEGELITITPSAIDPDGNALTYSYSSPFNAQGQWQTDYKSAGTYNVTVTVSDGSLTDLQQVKVSVLNVNRPPSLNFISDILVNEGQLVIISPTATDPDADVLTHSFTSPFNSEGKWQTTYRDAGVYNITVTASDGELADSQNVIVNVINVNTAPTVSISLSRINVAVNDSFSFIVNVDDADYDPLTLALYKDSETQPFFSGNVFDYYVGTTSFSTLGVHTIKAIVTDTNNASAEATVNIEVVDPPSLWGKILPLLGDFNGDGLVDNGTYNKNSGRWAVSLSNFDGFGSINEWLNNFGASTDSQYVNGDFNGDGLTDITVYYQNTGVWQIRFSERTKFSDSGISVIFAASSSFMPVTGDFNGDGISDVGTYDKSNGNVTVALSEKTSFGSPVSWLSSFATSGMPFTGDFNADGLADIGVFNDGSWNFAVSDGTRFITQSSWTLNFGSGKSPVVSDFNNDGLTDIGIFDKNDGSWLIRLCNGNGFNSTTSTWLSNFGKGEYYTPYALDFNGDSLTDTAIYDNSTFTWQRLAAKGTVADLIKTITNSLGSTTEITYKSSVYYDNTGGDGICDLPFAIQTVSTVKQGDGLGNFYQINYSYANGLFASVERETRGFGYVKVIDVEGSISETWFKQDNIFKGLPYEERTRDSQGKLYSKIVRTYNYSTPYMGCNFPYLAEEEGCNYDGEITPKVIRTTYQYDNYGNITKISNLGDVEVYGDEKESNIEYVYNTTAWILNLPNHTYLKNASGQVVSEGWLYYDNNNLNYTDIPTKGLLTKEEKWLEPKPTGITNNPAIIMTYDDYGNLLTTKDALNNTTTTTYDATYHAFPEVITNPKGFSRSFTYDIKTGQVLTVADFNNQIIRNEYDVFGRIIKKFGPNDDALHPSVWYEYDLTTQPAKITISVREEYNTDDVNKISIAYNFIDGLGRAIQTKTEAEDTAKQIISEVVTFNNRGLVAQKFLSYFADKTVTYTIPDLSKPKLTYEYDPLGRLIKSTNPDGTTNRVEYKQWAVTTIDENGHKLRKINDAYGRIIKVEEFNHGEIYTTTYNYDALGNLISVVDNQGNTTAISYNSLGQKISLYDPDMGNWTYEYDLVGNLKKQADTKGQILEFNYDSLNRAIEKLANGQVIVTYFYDDIAVPYSKGRLTKVTDLSGTTEFFYDNLGREIKTLKTVDGTQYTVERAYDALDRIKSLKYPDGEIINHVYNKSGGVETLVGNETYVSNIDYTVSGQMQQINFGNATQTDYTYNSSTLRLEHLVTKDSAQNIFQDLQYQFDNVGNISTITDNKNTATQSFTYDDLNRLTSATGRTYGTKYYRYNSIGNMLEKEGVRYRYGENGAGPHALTSGDNGLKITYDANGNMLSKDNQAFEYDAENRLIKVGNPLAQNNINFDIILTPGWNFISIPIIPSDSRISSAFSSIQFGTDYEQVSRYNSLKSGFESYNNNPTFNQFDSVEYGKGYIIYVTNASGATLTLSGRLPDFIQRLQLKTGWNLIGTPSDTAIKASDALAPLIYNTDYDRIVRYNSSTGTYEDLTVNDNLQPGQSYYIRCLRDVTWEIKPRYESTQFVYDGDGGRVKKITSTSTTIYIGSLYEVENGTAKKHIFLGSNRIVTKESAGNTYYNHSDHLGSSNLITDQNGNQVSLTEFTPYGSISKQTGTYDPKYKFTGKELDNTGLYFYGARYYDPEIGRFITPDTLVKDYKDPQSLNRYSYCQNNPINYIDPSGYGWFKKLWRTIVSAVAGIVAFVGSGFNPVVGLQVFSMVNTGINLGTSLITGQGIGRAFGTFAASVAISAAFAYSGAHDVVNLGMRMGVFASEGAAIGAAGAAINKGDIGESALVGGATGTTIGFLSSEQFQNWRAGEGFLTHEAVAARNYKIAQMAESLGMGGDRYLLSILASNEQVHMGVELRNIEGTLMWAKGKYPNLLQDKPDGLLRNLAYLTGKVVKGEFSRESNYRYVVTYGINGVQAAMLQAYTNSGAGTFALSANCTDWAVGALRSVGIYIPGHQYSYFGFADPNTLERNIRQ